MKRCFNVHISKCDIAPCIPDSAEDVEVVGSLGDRPPRFHERDCSPSKLRGIRRWHELSLSLGPKFNKREGNKTQCRLEPPTFPVRFRPLAATSPAAQRAGTARRGSARRMGSLGSSQRQRRRPPSIGGSKVPGSSGPGIVASQPCGVMTWTTRRTSMSDSVTCPFCGAPAVEIAYGYPSSELFDAADRGRSSSEVASWMPPIPRTLARASSNTRFVSRISFDTSARRRCSPERGLRMIESAPWHPAAAYTPSAGEALS